MQDNRNNAEHKILILYALSQARYAMTKHDLSMTLMDNMLMTYYNFQDSFYGLKDGRFIRADKEGPDEFVEITESGRSMLELFSPNLDIHKRSMIDVYLENHKNEILDKNTLTANLYPLESGATMVELSAKEGPHSLFNLTIEVPSEEQANYIIGNWQKDPKAIYHQFIQLLTASK